MQNLRPSNIKVIFQRPPCGPPIAVASGFIAGTAPVVPTDWPDSALAALALLSPHGRLAVGLLHQPLQVGATRLLLLHLPINATCIQVISQRAALKRVKFSSTSYRALGPELIPVYRQSARRWREVNHAIDLAVSCHYFLPGLRLPL